MILDGELELSDAQNIAASTLSASATVNSTTVLVLTGGTDPTDAFGNAITPDIGEPGELWWNLQVNTTFVGASAAVLCTLATKASSASIQTSGTTLLTQTIPAVTAAGTRYALKVPAGTVSRYLGVVYKATGGNLTTGKVDSWLSLDHEKTD